MKKILAILLALTLALSLCGMLFSCGSKDADTPPDNGASGEDDPTSGNDDPTSGEDDPITDALTAYAETVKNSPATSVTTVITTVRDGVTLTARTELSADTHTVSYEVLNPLDMNGGNTEMTHTETVAAKVGENTVVMSGLGIAAANFSDYSISDGTLTATVSNPSAFFGTAITSFTAADVTITVINGAVTGMTVSYTTVGGSAVTLTVTVA